MSVHKLPPPRRYDPTRLRDFTPSDPDQSFWHEPPPRPTFVDDTQADIRADLREFNRLSLCAIVVALVAVALIWWAQP